MKKEQEEKEPNHERWLLSYADFITLLMVFFILLYSMSNVDIIKYKKLTDSLSVAMGAGKSIIELQEESVSPEKEQKKGDDTAVRAETEEDKLENIKQKLDEYLKENGLSGSVTTVINERGLVTSLNDTTFFDSGKAVIRTDSLKKLIEIGRIINNLGNYIRVEGHTDNVPINTFEFKSNWQLSAIRATNVAELMIDQSGIAPEKISAVGYGQYRPIDSNDTEQGRARNRRVDIVILSSKFNGAEDGKK